MNNDTNRNIIDCDVDPFVDSGFVIESHQKQGRCVVTSVGNDLLINNKRIVLYLSKRQEGIGTIAWDYLLEELNGKVVLGANVGLHLYEHSSLIPQAWRGRSILFPGTIFRDPRGLRYIGHLNSYHDWYWGYSRLDRSFGPWNPVALLEA